MVTFYRVNKVNHCEIIFIGDCGETKGKIQFGKEEAKPDDVLG